MRKNYIFLIFLVIFFSRYINVFSQGFTFHRVGANTITVDSNTAIRPAVIMNTSTSVLNFKIARIGNILPGTWSSNICTSSACYPPDIDTIPPAGEPSYSIGPGARDTFTVDAYCPTEGTGYIIIKVFIAGNPSQFVIDTFNVHRSTSDIRKLSSLVSDFKLEQNYPNPFNPSTIINFSLPKAGLTSLIVYDLTGREVAKLLDGINLHEGNYSFDFNAENFNLTSGVYIYKLNTPEYVSVRKMMLIK